MYTYICVYIYIYLYTYICVYIFKYVCMCIYSYVCVLLLCLRWRRRKGMPSWRLRNRRSASATASWGCVRERVCVRVRVCIDTCVNIQFYVCVRGRERCICIRCVCVCTCVINICGLNSSTCAELDGRRRGGSRFVASLDFLFSFWQRALFL